MKTLSPIRAFCVYFVNWYDSNDTLHALTHDFFGIYGAPAMAVALFLCACVGHRGATTERMHNRVSAIAGAMIDLYGNKELGWGHVGVDYKTPSKYSSDVHSYHCSYLYE